MNAFNAILPLTGVKVKLALTKPLTSAGFYHAQLSAFLRTLLQPLQKYSEDEFYSQIGLIMPMQAAIEEISFSIVATASGQEKLHFILKQLQNMPASLSHIPLDDNKVFSHNMSLLSIHDLFTDMPYSTEFFEFDSAALHNSAILLRQQTSNENLQINGLSPCQLRERKSPVGAEALAANHFSLWWQRLLDSINTLAMTIAKNTQSDKVAKLEIDKPNWRLQHYSSNWHKYNYSLAPMQKAIGKDKKKCLDGVLYEATFQLKYPLNIEQAKLLTLGKYIGLGTHIAFGNGRYCLAFDF